MNNNKTIFKIKNRCYNGDYGIGSVFNHEYIFIIQQELDNPNQEYGIIKYSENIEFCCDEKLGSRDLASIHVEIPYLVENNKINKFNELISKIKSDMNYKYNENHYSKDKFDPKWLNYMDIIIDDEEYETDDLKILDKIYEIIDIQSCNKLTDEYYARMSNLMKKQNGQYYYEDIELTSLDPKLSINLIPDNLKNFISFDDEGYVFANQKLPKELENEYNTFVENYYSNDNKVVNNIVNRIGELPYNIETTIAELINYNPENSFISPLTQGIISNAVKEKCRNNSIILEENKDSLGGLAYYIKFRKIQSNDENVLNNYIKESDMIDDSSSNNQKKYVYSYKEYRELFEHDENNAFVRLIIPKSEGIDNEELNLIGKLPTDYTLDEIVIMKKYAHYIYERILNPNGTKDIKNTVEVLVKVIDDLPKGTEISISQILGNHFKDYETNELFEINKNVISVCREKGINLNFGKYDILETGLPFNVPFIKE